MPKKKNKSSDNLVSDIAAMINSLKPMAEAALKESKPRVDYIIENKIVDANEIEHLLENLLNLILSGTDDIYFFKLLNYYATIDKEASDFYLAQFKDL